MRSAFVEVVIRERIGVQSNIERAQKQAEMLRTLMTENMHTALDASAQTARKVA